MVGPGTKYDVRGELETYCNGEDVASVLMRFGGMSLEDAVDSVRASGGKVSAEYMAMLRASL